LVEIKNLTDFWEGGMMILTLQLITNNPSSKAKLTTGPCL